MIAIEKAKKFFSENGEVIAFVGVYAGVVGGYVWWLHKISADNTVVSVETIEEGAMMITKTLFKSGRTIVMSIPTRLVEMDIKS